MNETADFECSRCATCCKNLIETSDNMKRGLPLTKEEALLFPTELVLPKLGVGLKAPETVILYQLALNCCPHLNEQNECQVYAKRPLMCQSFPIVAGAISNRCRMFSYRKPGATYAEPYRMTNQVKASSKLEKYMEKQIRKYSKKGLKTWEYDLNTQTWLDRGTWRQT